MSRTRIGGARLSPGRRLRSNRACRGRMGLLHRRRGGNGLFRAQGLWGLSTEPVFTMSLSPEEYREHLATTAVRAGFSFGEVVLPQSHEFHLGRMRFHYLDWGNKQLPTIVFLHGGALTAHTWDLVCLAMRDDFHCVALDQRGHGDTDWAHDGDYSIGAALADTKGFVDHLGLDRFILVGMSLGAINSLAFAVAHPERLSHLDSEL